MAGHSKWANIQHRKNAQDNKRGKIFTKLIREITVAARVGGPDPASNPRLRTALEEANASNMAKDTVDRAIKRGAGGGDEETSEEIRYEGYGPAGIAFVVDCLTNNRNRTAGEVRHAFTDGGGNLGTPGSVAYLFTKQGWLTFAPGANEDKITEVAIEAGAQDVVVNEDGSIDVVTLPNDLTAIKAAMLSQNLQPAHALVTENPSLWIKVTGEQAIRVQELIELLEDLDDVQKVYTNAELE